MPSPSLHNEVVTSNIPTKYNVNIVILQGNKEIKGVGRKKMRNGSNQGKGIMPFLMLMMQESGKTQTQKNTENMKFKLQLLNFEMCLSR